MLKRIQVIKVLINLVGFGKQNKTRLQHFLVPTVGVSHRSQSEAMDTPSLELGRDMHNWRLQAGPRPKPSLTGMTYGDQEL